MHSRRQNNSMLRSTNNLMMRSTSSNSMNKITKRKDNEIKNILTTNPLSPPIKFGKLKSPFSGHLSPYFDSQSNINRPQPSPPKVNHKYNDSGRILMSQCDPITRTHIDGSKIVYKKQDKENQNQKQKENVTDRFQTDKDQFHTYIKNLEQKLQDRKFCIDKLYHLVEEKDTQLNDQKHVIQQFRIMESFILKLSEKMEVGVGEIKGKEIFGKYLKLCLKHDQLEMILGKETLQPEKKYEIQDMVQFLSCEKDDLICQFLRAEESAIENRIKFRFNELARPILEVLGLASQEPEVNKSLIVAEIQNLLESRKNLLQQQLENDRIIQEYEKQIQNQSRKYQKEIVRVQELKENLQQASNCNRSFQHMEEENFKYKRQLEILTNQLQENDQFRTRFHHMEEENMQYKRQIDILADQLQENEQIKSSLSNELENQKKYTYEISLQNQNYLDEITQKNQLIINAEDQLANQMQLSQEQFHDYQIQLTKLQNDRIELTQKVNRNNQIIKDKEHILNQSLKELDNNKSIIKGYEIKFEELSKINEENQQIQQIKLEEQQIYKQALQDIDKYKLEITIMTKQLEEKQIQYEQDIVQNQKQEEIQKINHENLQNQQIKFEQLQNIYKDAQLEIYQYKQEITQNQVCYQANQDIIQDLSKNINLQVIKIDFMTNQIATLEEQKDQIMSLIQQKEGEIECERLENDKLTQLLNIKSKQYEEYKKQMQHEQGSAQNQYNIMSKQYEEALFDQNKNLKYLKEHEQNLKILEQSLQNSSEEYEKNLLIQQQSLLSTQQEYDKNIQSLADSLRTIQKDYNLLQDRGEFQERQIEYLKDQLEIKEKQLEQSTHEQSATIEQLKDQLEIKQKQIKVNELSYQEQSDQILFLKQQLEIKDKQHELSTKEQSATIHEEDGLEGLKQRRQDQFDLIKTLDQNDQCKTQKNQIKISNCISLIFNKMKENQNQNQKNQVNSAQNQEIFNLFCDLEQSQYLVGHLYEQLKQFNLLLDQWGQKNQHLLMELQQSQTDQRESAQCHRDFLEHFEERIRLEVQKNGALSLENTLLREQLQTQLQKTLIPDPEITQYIAKNTQNDKLLQEIKSELNETCKKLTVSETYKELIENLLEELLYNKVSLNRTSKKCLNDGQKEKIDRYTKRIGELQAIIIDNEKLIKQYEEEKREEKRDISFNLEADLENFEKILLEQHQSFVDDFHYGDTLFEDLKIDQQ